MARAWLDRQIQFDAQWEAKVCRMLLRNMSFLFETPIANLRDLNRYRKALAARLPPLGKAA